MNAKETVTRASELNNGEVELCVDTETADDDAINDIPQDSLVSSNDKLHIDRFVRHTKGAKRHFCRCNFSIAGGIESPRCPRGSDAMLWYLVFTL